MCGSLVEGGEEGCQKLFEKVLALEYSDLAFGAVHLITVDCYALQHSEIHRPYSNAFHLLRLGWIQLRDGNPKIGKTDLDFKRYAKDLRTFPFLQPPKDRGKITIVDVANALDAAAHKKIVEAWGKETWDAWAAYHAWVDKLLGI